MVGMSGIVIIMFIALIHYFSIIISHVDVVGKASVIIHDDFRVVKDTRLLFVRKTEKR